MSRSISAFLAALFIAALTVGCGGSTETAVVEQAETAETDFAADEASMEEEEVVGDQ